MRSENYFKALDLLRFLAATLVVAAHAHYHLAELGIKWHDNAAILFQGGRAVLFFFCLSGFLLTCRSIQEQEGKHTIDIRKFYYRRALRIWPLYYLTVLLCFLFVFFLFPVFYPSFDIKIAMPAGLICTLFFIPNFLTTNGLTNFGAINNLWSIGVEEGFYLFFPLLLLCYKKTRNYTLIFSVALAIQLSGYIALEHSVSFLPLMLVKFLHTYVFHFMLVSCIVASLWVQCREYPAALRVLNAVALLLGAGAAVLMLSDIHISAVPGECLLAVLFSVVILFAAQVSNRLLENNVLVYYGKISYGIYLFHPFVSYGLRFLYTRSALFSGLVQKMPGAYFMFLLVLTVLAAHLSYRFFEQWFLKLKNKAADA